VKPESLLYRESHEWCHVEGDTATIGISAFAFEQLTDVTFVDLPKVGAKFQAGGTFGEIESVKSVNDLFAPVALEVTAVNAALLPGGGKSDSEIGENLKKMAADPYGFGWMIKGKVLDPAGLAKLLNQSAYEKLCADQAH